MAEVSQPHHDLLQLCDMQTPLQRDCSLSFPSRTQAPSTLSTGTESIALASLWGDRPPVGPRITVARAALYPSPIATGDAPSSAGLHRRRRLRPGMALRPGWRPQTTVEKPCLDVSFPSTLPCQRVSPARPHSRQERPLRCGVWLLVEPMGQRVATRPLGRVTGRSPPAG